MFPISPRSVAPPFCGRAQEASLPPVTLRARNALLGRNKLAYPLLHVPCLPRPFVANEAHTAGAEVYQARIVEIGPTAISSQQLQDGDTPITRSAIRQMKVAGATVLRPACAPVRPQLPLKYDRCLHCCTSIQYYLGGVLPIDPSSPCPTMPRRGETQLCRRTS